MNKPPISFIVFPIFILLLLTSCGTYRYYQPTPNAPLFTKKGELHISGTLGSSGASVKGALSVTDKIGFIGMYNSAFFDYRSREGELGLGYYTDARPDGIFVGGGLGFGSNFEYTDSTRTVKSYEGEFWKPFVQFNGGITSGDLIWGIKGDLMGIMKVNYFMYDGMHLDGSNADIGSDYLLLEPGVAFGLGSKSFKFDFLVSFPFRPSFEPLDNRLDARTSPGSVSIGLRYIVGHKQP